MRNSDNMFYILSIPLTILGTGLIVYLFEPLYLIIKYVGMKYGIPKWPFDILQLIGGIGIFFFTIYFYAKMQYFLSQGYKQHDLFIRLYAITSLGVMLRSKEYNEVRKYILKYPNLLVMAKNYVLQVKKDRRLEVLLDFCKAYHRYRTNQNEDSYYHSYSQTSNDTTYSQPENPSRKRYRELLRLDYEFSLYELRANYHTIAREFHPDLHADKDEKASYEYKTKMQEINEAYEHLLKELCDA